MLSINFGSQPHRNPQKEREGLMQACNITDRDQLRKHKSRISISRKSRTHILRLLSHFWAGSLVYITGSHRTMAMPHALMICHKVKCNGCVASCPYPPWDAHWAQHGTVSPTSTPDLGPDISRPARGYISQIVTVSWRWHMGSAPSNSSIQQFLTSSYSFPV